MPVAPPKSTPSAGSHTLKLARVLLVQDGLAPRLALQTILQAGGYSVDVAASASEAFCKLDSQKYELVLSDPTIEAPPGGAGVLSYARVKEYRPATALITAYHQGETRPGGSAEQQVSVPAEDVSSLLSKVADLIGARATRRSHRALRNLNP